jgi:hypothetical protein
MESLKEKHPIEAATTFLSLNESIEGLQSLANQLNRRLMGLGETDEIEHEIPFSRCKKELVALFERKTALIHSSEYDYEESHRLNTADNDAELFQRIEGTSNWVALNSIVDSETASLAARRAAAWRMVEVASTDLEKAYGLIAVLSQLLNDPDKRNRTADANDLANSMLQKLEQIDVKKELTPLVLQLKAKHELAKNELKEAKTNFDKALSALRNQSFGTLRGEVARDALAVFSSGLYRGFNLSACDQYRLSIIYYGGLEGGTPVYLPSIESLANAAREYFWENLYQPYCGYEKLVTDGD